MTADDGRRGIGTTVVARVRDRLGVRTVGTVLAGVLAGASLGVLGKDAVVVPVAGSVPGVVPGTVGVLVALGAYRRVGCCEECGGSPLGSDCDCTGDCGDSCSCDS